MALSDGLTGAPENQYGAEHKEHSIEIYKLYVEIADRISARRQSANSFFVSVNTAIVAFLGLLKSESVDGLTASAVWIIAFAGAALCYLWYRIVRSYRDLNSGKFKVIHEMERRLPLRPYDAEWSALGAGKDSALYLPVSHVEIVVPWIFAAIYVIALILTSRSTAGFEPSTAAIALETGGIGLRLRRYRLGRVVVRSEPRRGPSD